jgi:hypothetical protein
MVFTFLWGFEEPFMQKWTATWSSIQTHEAGSSAEVASKFFNKNKEKHISMVTLRPNFWNVFRPPKLEHHIRAVKETGAKKRPQNWDRIFAVLVALFSSQVRISWQWHRRLLNNLARSDEVLFSITTAKKEC